MMILSRRDVLVGVVKNADGGAEGIVNLPPLDALRALNDLAEQIRLAARSTPPPAVAVAE